MVTLASTSRTTTRHIEPHEATAIMAMMHKPRTAGDVAAKLGIHPNSAGRCLAALERMGKVRRAEIRAKVQIWEAVHA